MVEQTHNRDMSDEPDRQDLEDRVEQLESTISQMLPSRRDALKLGGAALVGGAAMSGSASAGTQQAGTIGTANDPVDLNAEDINSVSVNTERADITNETYIAATVSSGGGPFNAATFVNPWDPANIDNRSEFNASQQFSPDETAKYEVVAQARLIVGSAGTAYALRIQNVTDSTTLAEHRVENGSSNDFILGVFVEEFDSSKTYEVQITNLDSSFNTQGFEKFNKLRIRKSVVQP